MIRVSIRVLSSAMASPLRSESRRSRPLKVSIVRVAGTRRRSVKSRRLQLGRHGGKVEQQVFVFAVAVVDQELRVFGQLGFERIELGHQPLDGRQAHQREIAVVAEFLQALDDAAQIVGLVPRR